VGSPYNQADGGTLEPEESASTWAFLGTTFQNRLGKKRTGLLLLLLLCFLGFACWWSLPCDRIPVLVVRGLGSDHTSWDQDGALETFTESPQARQLGLRFGGFVRFDPRGKRKPSVLDPKASVFFLSFGDSGQSMQVLARQLQTAIQAITSRTHTRKVTLVTFSMGGVVAREYLVHHPRDHLVHGLLTVASPHRGSLAAYSYLLGDLNQLIASTRRQLEAIPQSPGKEDPWSAMVQGLKQAGRKLSLLSLMAVELPTQTLGKKLEGVIGVPLEAPALRQLIPPQGNSYLARLETQDLPRNVHYASVLLETHLDTKTIQRAAGELLQILSGEVPPSKESLESANTLAFGILNLVSSTLTRGDGVVTVKSQDLNQLRQFRESRGQLHATTLTRPRTAHTYGLEHGEAIFSLLAPMLAALP
jgi:pimeloyl-ACP methyl ester carboxylesterase